MLGPTSALEAVLDRRAAGPIALRATASVWRGVLVSALLSVAVASALGGAFSANRASSSEQAPRAGAHSQKSLSSLPLTAQGPISQALGSADRTYRISGPSGGVLKAANPAQRLTLDFGRAGAAVRSGGARLGLTLTGAGYGTSLTALGAALPRVSANRVSYSYPGLEEWYVNGPVGLEQGFTLDRAPSPSHDGPLVLSMAISGNVHASLAAGGQGVILSRAGAPALRYTGLTATDARGRELHGRFELTSGGLSIAIDARGAHYPLRIDPFIQQGEKLLGTGAIGTATQGVSVALASNGNTALVGGPEDGANAGAAWVFSRSGTTWTQQAKLVGSGASGKSEQGFSVALSGDGNTALIGGPEDDNGAGAAWVFTRAGTTWTQQGGKLVGSEPVGASQQGWSVALSSEGGNTALIGGPGDDLDAGAAWVFTRSGTTWTQQGEKLVGSEAVGEAEQGFSVALSAEGATALIGGPFDSSSAGAVWVFTSSGGVWTQQGAKLVGTGATGAAHQGSSVALASKGAAATALVGGPEDNAGAGAAWVFTRSTTNWSQQGSKLVGTGAVGRATEGSSVALSGDGSTAIVGGPFDNGGVGAVWVFVTQLPPPLAGALTLPGAVNSSGLQTVSLTNANDYSVNALLQETVELTGGVVIATATNDPSTTAITIASARKTIAAHKTVKLKLKLSKQALKLLRKHHRMKVTLRVTLSVSGRPSRIMKKTIVLHA
jgi:hypothetical protein